MESIRGVKVTDPGTFVGSGYRLLKSTHDRGPNKRLLRYLFSDYEYIMSAYPDPAGWEVIFKKTLLNLLLTLLLMGCSYPYI